MNRCKELFDRIAADRQSGSLKILNDTLSAVERCLKQGFSETELSGHLQRLMEIFPDFALLHHFGNSYSKAMAESQDIAGFLSRYSSFWKNADRKVAINFLLRADPAGKTLLLHSNSRTLHALFETLRQKHISTRVLQTVSSPGYEGSVQAKHIASLGFPVKLIPDNSVGKYLRNIDMFLSGADRITPDFVINKVNTRTIAELCQTSGIPAYALADSRKFTAAYPASPAPLFEKIPRELYTGIITEQ